MTAKLQYFLNQNIFINLEYGQSKKQFEFFRIAIALFSLFNFALFLIDYKIFLAPDGIISWEVTNANAYWFEPHLLKISQFLNADDMLVLVITSIFYIINLILLTLGLFTRITSFLAFGTFLLFSVQLSPFLYGVDLYQSFFLLILCIFPSGYSISLRPKMTNKKIINQQQIAIRCMQLYLSVTYFSAGFGKTKMDSWFNGEFLTLSLSDPNYQWIHFPEIPYLYFYIFLGTLVVIAETLYFILILIPYIRSILLIVIVTMHIFIGIFMGLFPFGLLLSIVNLIFWFPLLLTDFNNISKLFKKNESST